MPQKDQVGRKAKIKVPVEYRTLRIKAVDKTVDGVTVTAKALAFEQARVVGAPVKYHTDARHPGVYRIKVAVHA